MEPLPYDRAGGFAPQYHLKSGALELRERTAPDICRGLTALDDHRVGLHGTGTSLGSMLLYWLLGLTVLYPLCLGFRALKRRQSGRSLLRLL